MKRTIRKNRIVEDSAYDYGNQCSMNVNFGKEETRKRRSRGTRIEMIRAPIFQIRHSLKAIAVPGYVRLLFHKQCRRPTISSMILA